MKTFTMILCAALILAALTLQVTAQETGYFDRPRVYIEDDIAIPTTFMGAPIPQDKTLMWNISSAYLSSDKFKYEGQEVQQYLDVRLWNIRVSAEKMYGKTSFGASLPIGINEVRGWINNLPTRSDGGKLGDISIVGKRDIWTGHDGDNVTLAAAIELPTGKDNTRFKDSNASTNAFYPQNNQRLPLGWQPGSGSTDFILSAAYNKAAYRKAYSAVLACKLHGKGDEDVQLGNVWLLSLNTTKALSPNLAASLGLTYRDAKNDKYPYPLDPVLNGTTQNGRAVFLSPGLQFRTKQNLTLGLSFRFPISKPNNGLIQDSKWGININL